MGATIIHIYGHRAGTAQHAARVCHAGTALFRASRVVVPTRVVHGRAMGQAIGPRHGTRAEYPCRAAPGPACLISTTTIQLDNYQTTNNDHIFIWK
jgi:hypothetical protein